MTRSPIHVEVSTPPSFDRLQILLRILIAIGLGWFGITTGWLTFGLYLLLPIIAAISISLGEARFRTEVAPMVVGVLRWLLQFSAYMLLLTDRFPAGSAATRVELPITAKPSVAGALSRWITSLPSGLVLMLLWFGSGVVWVIAAIAVLFTTHVPGWSLDYQRAVLRWQARLVGYHASLVDDYPPFELDTAEADHAAALAAS